MAKKIKKKVRINSIITKKGKRGLTPFVKKRKTGQTSSGQSPWEFTEIRFRLERTDLLEESLIHRNHRLDRLVVEQVLPLSLEDRVQ